MQDILAEEVLFRICRNNAQELEQIQINFSDLTMYIEAKEIASIVVFRYEVTQQASCRQKLKK